MRFKLKDTINEDTTHLCPMIDTTYSYNTMIDLDYKKDEEIGLKLEITRNNKARFRSDVNKRDDYRFQLYNDVDTADLTFTQRLYLNDVWFTKINNDYSSISRDMKKTNSALYSIIKNKTI